MFKLNPSRIAALDDATRQRLRDTFSLAVDYTVNVLILFLFAAADLLPFEVAFQILWLSLAISAAFAIAIGCGLTRSLSQSVVVGLQVLGSCGINLLGIVLAPNIAYIFIINLYVPLSYGSLHFSQRTFLAIWVGLSIALGAAMLSAGPAMVFEVTTPIQRQLLWSLVTITLGRFLAINAEVSRLRGKLEQRNLELASAAARLNELASRDELTGLWNRREFMRLLQEESRRAVRNKSNFSVALLDIDHFKTVNDKYGHIVGDAVLHELGHLLDESRRATDTVGRYGGEEFTLLLTGARLSTATVALERTRHRVANHDWQRIAPDLKVTISAGVAQWKPGETLTDVLGRADAAMYEAKRAGRNLVRASSDPLLADQE